MNHGELTYCTADDGHQIRGVVVEISRVPKGRRRRLLDRWQGVGLMKPSDYILCYGIAPWEGSRARATRCETIH